MAYTDKTKVANYLERDLTSRESTMCDLLIPAIKRHIDSQCSMTFEKVDGETNSVGGTGMGTRYFEASGERTLFLENCVVRNITAINELDSDGTTTSTLDPDNFEAFPLNKPAKRYIKLSSRNGRWTTGLRAVSITGEFSYADTAPEDIQLAATIMVAELLRNPQRLSSESIEGYSKVFADYIGVEHPEVMMVLGHYARIKV